MTTENLTVKNKDIVVPGEILAEGMGYLPGQGTYRDGENVVAGMLGLVDIVGRTLRLIPLSGRYMPKKGDAIICKVTEVNFSGWRVDINSASTAMLSVKDATSSFIARGADLTRYYNIGDYIFAGITNVAGKKFVDITTKGPGLRKLEGGHIVEVNTNKVPRIIGKQGSMITMIKDATGCNIVVGQNGLIWIQGKPEQEFVAVKAIKKIEKESHLPGLTDRIKEFLDTIKR